MWTIAYMTKIIDHQQTGKRKWIKGPGLKKDRDLKIYEDQSKLDLAADNYLKKVDEKKGINNKVIINPKLSEAVKEMGGELLEIAEIDKEGDKEDPKQAQIASKQKRAAMIKKQVLMKKLQAVRAGSDHMIL